MARRKHHKKNRIQKVRPNQCKEVYTAMYGQPYVNPNDLNVGDGITQGCSNFYVEKCRKCSNNVLIATIRYGLGMDCIVDECESDFMWFHCKECNNKYCTNHTCISCDHRYTFLQTPNHNFRTPPDTCSILSCLEKRLKCIRNVLVSKFPLHIIEIICESVSRNTISYWKWHLAFCKEEYVK
jgi:hypothetical protein